MHARLFNTARLTIGLRPCGPVMVRSGRTEADPSSADICWVRAPHGVVGSTVYMPGSGLKGALRSHGERILRSLGHGVCDVFDARTKCRSGKSTQGSDRYRQACPACRTFGSSVLRGRCSVTDAYPWAIDADAEQQRAGVHAVESVETRTSVAIDRRTGAPQGGALFRAEVVAGGRFEAEVRLWNFQLWQLALIGAVLRHLDDGLFQIGGSGARGMGRVRVELTKLVLTQTGGDLSSLRGVADLDPSAIARYGLIEQDTLALPAGGERGTVWRGSRVAWGTGGIESVFDTLARSEVLANAPVWEVAHA